MNKLSQPAADTVRLYHELVDEAMKNTRTIHIPKSDDNDIDTTIDIWHDIRNRCLQIDITISANGKKYSSSEKIQSRDRNKSAILTNLIASMVHELVMKQFNLDLGKFHKDITSFSNIQGPC